MLPNPPPPLYIQAWLNLCPSSQSDASDVPPQLDQQHVLEWASRIIEQEHPLEKNNIDLKKELEIFLKDVHGIQRETVADVRMGFGEAVGFVGWMQAKIWGKRDHQQDQGEQQKKNNNQNTKNQDQINSFVDRNTQQATEKPRKQGTKSQSLPCSRDFLVAIFQHYCRLSSNATNDPTFQQMLQKIKVMTINKFMVFCKDFGLLKLNGITRQAVVEIFKKNSEFYKHMNFQQFIAVLVKIAGIVYGADGEETAGEGSKQFLQFLLFLELNNLEAFKKKMQCLNISYHPKIGSISISKAGPQKQKQKLKQSLKKQQQSSQSIEQFLQNRKMAKSQNKLKPQINIRKQSNPKQIIKIQQLQKLQLQKLQLQKLKQPSDVQSNKFIRKELAPVTMVQRISRRNVQEPAHVLGYANIHRLKNLGKNGQDSRMKLNAVVEQARKMMDNREYYNNEYLTQSIVSGSRRLSTQGPSSSPTNRNSRNNQLPESRAQTCTHTQQSTYSQHNRISTTGHHEQRYTAHGHSQLQKRKIIKTGNSELQALINNDSDQDEYLEEHLKREKVNGFVNQRILRKIRDIQERG